MSVTALSNKVTGAGLGEPCVTDDPTVTPASAVIGQLCAGEKGLPLALFFILYTTSSDTFHVNNRAQHYERLPGETAPHTRSYTPALRCPVTL